MELSQPANESRVLVIYTGGTIGMLVGQQGYVPEPYFLTKTLRSQTRFHDPMQDSLFSHSSSVQGFRDWNSGSGRSSPQADIPRTLLVRSSRPIGHPSSSASMENNQPTCVQVSESVYEAQLPSLVTPCSAVPGGTHGKSIRYAILEWNPLMDSSNIEMEDWIRIATEIELNYTFDAFVILHGTDTMAYTSSALSFMLEDLGKTVILTGAQIPMSQLRNDAVDNFMGALMIAGHFIIPESSLYFNHTLYRGNRVLKMSSYDLSAFNSPNFPPLVNVGVDIVVNWNDVLRQTSLRRFRAHKKMSPHVAILRLFPGIAAATVSAFFMPLIRGVVLETFGLGNAPQRADLMQALKEACDRGIVVVAITQCVKGSVRDAYETGRTLLQVGVVSGGDMTPECALTKLSYLLSKPELSVKEVRELIATPLRGELSGAYRSAPSHPATVEHNLEQIGNILSQFIRLSHLPSHGAQMVASPDSIDTVTRDAAASWSWTAAEAASTEAVLIPCLIHLAAARDDIGSIKFCLDAVKNDSGATVFGNIAGGVVNCLELSSGKSPLHVAAINGNTRSVGLLLGLGAVVHLRDTLGHTPLYYAARQGHDSTVDVLVQAGATLGGFDETYAALAIKNAYLTGDQTSLRIWTKTGVDVSNDH
ncbi:L-asparaginase [Tricholoma matsutake]|nr:L-asparaginase [Tricholoma matsutake 945]